MEEYTIQEYLDFQKEVQRYISHQPERLRNYLERLGLQVLWRRVYFTKTDETIWYASHEKLKQQYSLIIGAIGIDHELRSSTTTRI